MVVYVVTFGVAAYEDNVFVVGVYSSRVKAETSNLQNRKHRCTAQYGEHWYDIEEFEVDAS